MNLLVKTKSKFAKFKVKISRFLGQKLVALVITNIENAITAHNGDDQLLCQHVRDSVRKTKCTGIRPIQ